MKKILLFLMTICAFAIANAQCDLKINNLVITVHKSPDNPPDPTPTTINGDAACVYTFDASFDILTNSGFKYLFFHSWRTVDYTGSSFDCSKSNSAQDPPTAATLGTNLYTKSKSFMDLGFLNLNTTPISSDPSNPTNITANIAKTYPNDPSVHLINTDSIPDLTARAYIKIGPGSIADTLHFEIKNIKVVVQGACNTLLGVTTDIWGSNSASGTPKAQCYICGQPQIFNDPSVTVGSNCQRQYFININSISTPTIKVWYRLYAHDPSTDLDPLNPVLDPSKDALIGEPVDSIPVSASSPYQSGLKNLPVPYCCTSPWSEWSLYAVVTQKGSASGVQSNLSDPGCAPLPVNLKSFNALRKNRSTVDLTWETAQEQNNKGFFVQRKLSNGVWQNVDFVESKAINGNSNSPITYTFTDLNDAKGVSQYRLRQLDIDGKQNYSLIRSVRGDGQKTNTIIYPNPSNDGKVSILFADANSIRDISLLDVSGRTIKQWRNVTNNNIQIDNLNAGFYTIRIVDTQTGEQVVEKFIVNKR